MTEVVLIRVRDGGRASRGGRAPPRCLGLNGPRQSDIPNAGLNRIRVRGDAIDILDWADTRHLADLPPQPVYDQKSLAGAEPPKAGRAPSGGRAKPLGAKPMTDGNPKAA